MRRSFAAMWLLASSLAQARAGDGIVVEAIDPRSAAAGLLQPGDRVIAWRTARDPGAGYVPVRDAWEWQAVQLAEAGAGPIDIVRRRAARDEPVRLPATDWAMRAQADAGAVALDDRCNPLSAVASDADTLRATAWATMQCGLEQARRTRTSDDERLAARVDEWLRGAAASTERAVAAMTSARWRIAVRDAAAAASSIALFDGLPEDAAKARLRSSRDLTAAQVAILRWEQTAASEALARLDREIAASLPDSMLQAQVWTLQGYLDSGLGQGLAHADAERLLERARRALAIAQRDAPHGVEEAAAQLVLGLLHKAAADYPEAARALGAALAIHERSEGQSFFSARTALTGLGNTHWAAGDRVGARQWLEQAAEAARREFPRSTTMSRNHDTLALLALESGDLLEAAEHAEASRAILSALDASDALLAPNRQIRGLIALRRGALDDAQRLLQQARQGYLGRAPLDVAWMDLFLGEVAQHRGDTRTAIERFRGVIAHYPESRITAEAYLGIAQVALQQGDAATARDGAERARRIMERVDPTSEQLARALFLHALAGGPARDHCRAVDLLEAARADFSGDPGRRGWYQSRHGAIYRACIETLAARDVAAAFAVSERYRARGLLERLVGRARRLQATLAPAQRAQQESLRRTIAAMQAQPAPADARAGIDFHARLASLRARVAEIDAQSLRELGRSDAGEGGPLDAAQAAGLLGPTSAALAWVVGEDATRAFVLRPLPARPVVVTIAIPAARLRSEVLGLRTALLERRADAAARLSQLGRRLFEPLEPHLQGVERLIVIPDQELHLLPFAALRSVDGRHLVERFAITLAGSMSMLRELQGAASPRAPATLLAVGDPALDDYAPTSQVGGHFIARLPGLPRAGAEASGVASLYGDRARLLTGRVARESTVRAAAADAGVLHVASHGIFVPASPMSSALIFAPPAHASAPDGRDDGIVRVWEIIDDWRLEAQLVVLSACDSGIEDLEGADSLSSFARAFQFAGARQVVNTLWSVPDRATERLMLRFHRERLSGSSADVALQRAQLSMLGATAESTAGARRGIGGLRARGAAGVHPVDWAAVTLWGDGR